MSISWTTIRGREIIEDYEGAVEEEYVGECAVQRSVSVDGTSANLYRRLPRIRSRTAYRIMASRLINSGHSNASGLLYSAQARTEQDNPTS